MAGGSGKPPADDVVGAFQTQDVTNATIETNTIGTAFAAALNDMPHPQSAIFRNHQRAARMRKRAQPSRMEETLDGDRVLELMQSYIRSGEQERAVTVAEIVEGVELLFSSIEKRRKFSVLRTRARRQSFAGHGRVTAA